MLTRLTPDLPSATHPEVVKLIAAIRAAFETLNRPDVLEISEATGSFEALEVIASSVFPTSSTTPTPTSGSGTFTTVSAAQQSVKIGNRRFYTVTVTITTNGTAATDIRVPMPDSAAETTAGAGVDTGSGAALGVFVTGNSLRMFTAAGAYPGADGKVLVASGSYRV